MNAADRLSAGQQRWPCLALRRSRRWRLTSNAYDLVRAHGEAGWTARLIPLTVDGLIYASSMVMLDSARRATPVPALARWLLGLGIAATLAAKRRSRLGPWPWWRGGGRVAGGGVGRFLRAAHDGHPQLPGFGGRAHPGPSATPTRCGSGRLSCSPGSWRRTGFPRCARSALSSMLASPGTKAARLPRIRNRKAS